MRNIVSAALRSWTPATQFSEKPHKKLSSNTVFLLLILVFSSLAISQASAAPVTITSLSVSSATTAGNISTVITGTSLSGATSVTVGGVAATIGANTDTSLTITVPAGTVGQKDVVVTAAAGSATKTSGFTYYTTLTPACGTSGSFTIANNIVTSNSSCTGTVTVPEGVVEIAAGNVGGLGFYQAAISGTVSLPSTLKTIGVAAFYMTGQISVIIPRGVTTFSDSAFWESNIVSLTFETPTSLTTIPASAIRSTRKLTTLTLPEGITTLGDLAIAAAAPATIRTISLPSTLNSINARAFSGQTFVCVANPGNNTLVNNFAFAAGPLNFPVAGNALSTAAVTRVANIADCPGQPTITSLDVTSGPTVGGTTVVITGTNLTGTRQVKFGTFNATVISSTSTTATVVSGAAVGTTLSNLYIHLAADGGWKTSDTGTYFSYTTVPNKLTVTRAAPLSSVSNSALSVQPRIYIQDGVGNNSWALGANIVVTATISTGGTLVGTQTATANANGIATFSNLGIAGEGGQTYTVTYSANGLASASNTVRIARNCNGVAFTCEVGDIGPGGGTIFYVAPTTFTQAGATGEMCTTDCKYLEVAPAGWSTGVAGSLDPGSNQWSTNTTVATGQDFTTASNEGYHASEKVNWKIGQGYLNTSLMKVAGATTTMRDLVVAYRGVGNTTPGQWFVPSVNELNELCKYTSNKPTGNPKIACTAATITNADLIIGFVAYRYNSSSEYSAANAWFMNIGNNVVSHLIKTGDNGGVHSYRPIRAFAPPVTYGITFKAGANGSGADQTATKSKGVNLALPDSATANGYFTRAGYTVTGWSTSDGGAQTHTLGGTFITEAITSLYPVWTGNTLTVTYSTNGGSSVDPASTITGGSVSSAANPPTKSGYTFAGWSVTNGGTAITFPFSHGKTADFNLYALWTANSYVLSYVYNSATGGSSTSTSNFTTGGSAITLPNPTRTGYNFSGWYSDESLTTYLAGGGASYSPSGTSLTPTAYAKWTGIPRTVTYSAPGISGGSVPTDSNTYLIGELVDISGNSGLMVKTGYTFAGWTYASDGTGPVLTYGMQYTTATSNMTFYAKWTANTYTINFKNNGASGLPSMTTTTYTSGGTAVTLPTVGTMTKTGFDFSGWSTTATGTALSGPYTTATDIDLWAVWTIKSINITYSEGTATRSSLTNFPSNTSGNYGTTITLNNTLSTTTTISGSTFEFTGWSDGASIYRAGSAYVLGETAPTFTAIWTKIFGVRYSFNGGTPAIGTYQTDSECLGAGNTCADGQQIVANEAPYRAGYTFAGWVDQNNLPVAAGSPFTVSASRYLIYANWTPIDYTISYSTAGGSAADSPFTKQRGQTFSVANEPTKTGYTFDGWNDGVRTFGAQSTYYVDVSAVTLTAQWRANVYTIDFDWNGGIGSLTSPQSYTVGGNALTLPALGNHVKDGYSFGGWSLTRNGAQISDNFIPTSSATLYARWGTGSFTVTYEANNGQMGISSASILNGSSLTLPTPTRDHFVFEGWYSADSGGTLIGAAQASFAPTESTTLYAHWTQASLYGIPASSLTRIGTLTVSNSATTTFTSNNGVSSVSVSVPAGALPAGTVVSFDLVGDFTRAQTVLASPNTYILSLVVSWLALDETVPDTAAGKPISLTLSNSTIRAGVSVYGIVGGNATPLGTASQDGTVTVSITSDPEVVVFSSRPSAPSGVAATSNGVNQSRVSWTAPNDGGSAIGQYTVTASGGQTCTTATTSCTVGALANGTSYTFTVTATNINGTSSSSSSATAKTAGRPGAPTAVTASNGAIQESVISWSAPSSDGGSAITVYTVTASNGSTCSSVSTSCTVLGLEDGADYTFTVTATNVLGTSSSSSTASARTAELPGTGGGGGGGGSDNPTPGNVIKVPPVKVIGARDAKVITVEIGLPSDGSTSTIKVDTASSKAIAVVKMVNGNLVLTPARGYSGVRVVTVTITQNGADRVIQVPLTVLPEPVKKPVVTPLSGTKSIVKWVKSPNAKSYSVYVSSKRVCYTAKTTCTVQRKLGPTSIVSVVSNGAEKTSSKKARAVFKRN